MRGGDISGPLACLFSPAITNVVDTIITIDIKTIATSSLIYLVASTFAAAATYGQLKSALMGPSSHLELMYSGQIREHLKDCNKAVTEAHVLDVPRLVS